MCIAICSPENTVIPLDHLKQSFTRNSDGAGFMYAEDGVLHIRKGFMDFDSFLEAYKPHENKTTVVHFRIKTHGEISPENTHPFQVGKNLAFIHNGIINAISTKDKKEMSDTYHFSTKILSKMYSRDSRFIWRDWAEELVSEYIGHSKLIFLNNKGHYKIVNEHMGDWDKGIWYSNKSYQPPQKIAPWQSWESNKSPVSFAVGDTVKFGGREGEIIFFGNGNMVGILLDGATQVITIPMPSLTKVQPTTSYFKLGDWVIRRSESAADANIGTVSGFKGDELLVNWDFDEGLGKSTWCKQSDLALFTRGGV